MVVFVFLHTNIYAQASINLETLIGFKNRGRDYTNLSLTKTYSWPSVIGPYSGYQQFGNIGYQNNTYNSWQIRFQVKTNNGPAEIVQKIVLYELPNKQIILQYSTNSENAYQQKVANLNPNNIVVNPSEDLFNLGVTYNLPGRISVNTNERKDQYYESNNEFLITIYSTGIVSNYNAKLAWNELERNGYAEDDLRDYIKNYPYADNIQEAKKKLEETVYLSAVYQNTIESYDAFINEFKSSKYFDDVVRRKKEIEFERLLNSNDLNELNLAYSNESNQSRKQLLFNAIHKIKYNLLNDSLSQLNQINDKISLIKKRINAFNGSEYFEIFQEKINQYEFEKLPASSELKCQEYDYYLKEYPKSKYINVVKNKLLECNTLKTNRVLVDSLKILLNTAVLKNQYQEIIRLGNAVIKVSKLNEKETTILVEKTSELLKFIIERRSKNYDVAAIDPNYYTSQKIQLKDLVFKESSNLRNLNISSNIEVQYDTFGKVSTYFLNNSSKDLERKITKPLNAMWNHEVFQKNNYPIMAKSDLSFNYSNSYTEFKVKKLKNGTFELTENIGLNPVQRRALNDLIQSASNYKPGIYKIGLDQTKFNLENKNAYTIANYKSFGGVLSAVPSILIPGLGTKLVTGKKGKAWISVLSYGLVGAGIYYYSQYKTTYDLYLSATSQSEKDKLYEQANTEYQSSLSSFAIGLGIYTVNLTYVIFKGTSNTLRTIKLNKKYQKVNVEI